MTATEFLIYGLAVWRLSSLFVNEEGPYRIFRRIRERFGITHSESGVFILIPDGLIPQALSCVWCASLWIALPFVFFYGIAAALALSAFAIFVDVAIKKLQQ